MATVHLIRHGQASFGADDYDALSPTGVVQSQRLGDWLQRTGAHADRIVLGAMKRHHQTFDGCLASWGDAPEPVIDASFNEYDFMDVLRPVMAPGSQAEWSAATPEAKRAFQQVFALAVARWIAGEHNDDYGETWPVFRSRCLDGLRRAGEGDGHVYVFTSGGPIATLIHHALGGPSISPMDMSWRVHNTSLSRLVVRGGAAHLAMFNAVPHLDLSGDATLYTYR